MSILYGFYEGRRWRNPRQRRTRAHPFLARGDRARHRHGASAFHAGPPRSACLRTSCSAPRAARCSNKARRRSARSSRISRRNNALEVDPNAIVGELSVGLQQRVEILKALVRGAEILVLDEPTAVLTPSEADQLFEMLRCAAVAKQDDHLHHPQAARDHGADRSRLGDAARRDGGDFRDIGDLATGACRRDGWSQGDPQGREGRGASGRGCARGAWSDSQGRSRRNAARQHVFRTARR